MKVVIAFPFSIYPVTTGGAVRGYHLLKELSRHYDVEAIVTDSPSLVLDSVAKDLGEELKSLKVSVAEREQTLGVFRKIKHRAYTVWLSRSLTVKSNTITLAVAKSLSRILKIGGVDAVILTTQELAICGHMVERRAPNTLRIMDMHNVDHILFKQQLESENKFWDKQTEYEQLKKHESRLCRYSDAVFACSEDDLNVLFELNQSDSFKGRVIPNGVDLKTVLFDHAELKSSSKNILFCGTLAYFPNIDGLNWFHLKIWPQVIAHEPDARLIVIGRELNLSDFPGLVGDSTVELVGEVESLEPYYHAAGLAICPLRMGSGTRFKIVEAMAFGNPVVSTSLGCQGLGASHGEHLLICDTEKEFANEICRLMTDSQTFEAIRQSARQFVYESFDWVSIGKKMRESINKWRR